MEEFEKYTLAEIVSMNNEKLLNRYFEELENLKYNRISSKVVEQNKGLKLMDIIELIQEEEDANRSYELFPGDLVCFYPNIKENCAQKQITCDFSGSIIYPGSLYINYRPLLENISTNNCYVLKRTIKVEIGYVYNLPTTIKDFEQLKLNMQLGNYLDGIDFSHFNQAMGGVLNLQKLNKDKKEKRYNYDYCNRK